MTWILLAIVAWALFVFACIVLVSTYRELERRTASHRQDTATHRKAAAGMAEQIAALTTSNEFWRLNVLEMERHCHELEAANQRQATSHSAELAMIAKTTARLFVAEGMERHD